MNEHIAEPFAQILNDFAPKVKPVRVLTCYLCQGIGWVDVGETTQRCGQCFGRGRVATEGGEP